MALPEILALRAAGHPREALVQALALWKAHRHPAIADFIDVLGAEALAEVKVPTARNRAQFHQAWLAAVSDANPVLAGWVATGLTEKLEVKGDYFGLLRDDYTRTKYAAWFERLQALTSYPDDPRVASALTAVLEEPEYLVYDAGRTLPLYAPVVALLERLGDTRCIPRLEAVLANPRSSRAALRDLMRTIVPPLLKALQGTRLKPLPGEAEWRALVPTRATVKGGKSEAELLEAVLADPTDDAARLVYADLLSERGTRAGNSFHCRWARLMRSRRNERTHC